MRIGAHAQEMRKPMARPKRLMAAALVLCLGPALLQAQRGGETRGGPPPAHNSQQARPTQPLRQQRQPEQQKQPDRQTHGAETPPLPAEGFRGGSPGGLLPPFGRPGYPGGGGAAPEFRFPQGHLGSWLYQHRNMPLAGQEKLLQQAPSFQRLPKPAQQRLLQQLRQVDQMPQQQRERRLARAELIEHMTPPERRALDQSIREFRALPQERRAIVRSAFRDLRGVPLDQRQTVIDSKQYQRRFSPEERSILIDLLRAEPFDPTR